MSRASRGGARVAAGNDTGPELVPEIFDTGAERPASSGQFGAALLVGALLAMLELVAAPLVLVLSLAVSLLVWWMLDQPWTGRRRGRGRRGLTSRLLYLSTIMLIGLWLGTMFIFRASDPLLSSGFTTTLPGMLWGADAELIRRLNGMAAAPTSSGLAVPVGGGDGFAPFSLFVHGTAATVAVSLLGYAASSARRRLRRALRGRGVLPATRAPRPGPPTS